MEKSVYSLVLMDDLVKQVDKMAYLQNTSRSNLINQILAEYLSYTTPEKRWKDAFEEIVRLFGEEEAFQIQPKPSEAMLSVRSALRFKYNPTIRYSVELYRELEPAVGELRVLSRSQSRQLLAYLERFFTQFAQLECRYRSGLGLPPAEYRLEEGRFSRLFQLPDQQRRFTDSQLGGEIAKYIQMLDRMMNCYFEQVNSGNDWEFTCLSPVYKEYLAKANLIL